MMQSTSFIKLVDWFGYEVVWSEIQAMHVASDFRLVVKRAGQ